MFLLLSKNNLMAEASTLSKRRFTTKIRKHWIRGNNNDLSQGFFIGLLLNWTKDGTFATVNIWGKTKLEILVKTKLSQMKNFGETIEKNFFTIYQKRKIRGGNFCKRCKKFYFVEYTPHINIGNNTFACLISAHNTLSLSRH